MNKPKYAHITVPLVGEDGNAFAILGRVIKAMKRHMISEEEIKEFKKEAMSSNYDHLLQTVIKWVSVA